MLSLAGILTLTGIAVGGAIGEQVAISFGKPELARFISITTMAICGVAAVGVVGELLSVTNTRLTFGGVPDAVKENTKTNLRLLSK